MGCMLFSSPSGLQTCIEHVHRVNIILRNSTLTNVVYESTLAFNRKGAGSFPLKLKGLVHYCIFCFALLIAGIVIINKKFVSSQFTGNRQVNNPIKQASTVDYWCRLTLYKNTSSACSSDISYMRKYFENEKGICADPEIVIRERVFKTQSSPSYKDGNISRIPELKLDAG